MQKDSVRESHALLDWRVALEKVLAAVPTLAAEPCCIEQAVGRISAQDCIAPIEVPPFHNSAVDGYAVLAADTAEATPSAPRRLHVVGESRAGVPYPGELQSGQAVEIMTGATLPRGADAVVPSEAAVAASSGFVDILKPVRQGAAVRLAGADTRRGDVLLRQGDVVTPGMVGKLASCGIAEIQVIREPRIAVATSGDELIAPGAGPLREGMIYDSNTPMLLALYRSWGFAPQQLGHVSDSLDSVKATINRAAEFDFFVMTGGVSVGKYDYVKQAVQDLGGEVLFWRVNQQPGKPLCVAKLQRTLFLGMPGNPVACYMCSDVYLRPALRKARGERPPYLRLLRAETGEQITKMDARTAFHRANLRYLNGRFVAFVSGPPDSHILRSVTAHDGYVIVPAERAMLREGEPADFILTSIGAAERLLLEVNREGAGRYFEESLITSL